MIRAGRQCDFCYWIVDAAGNGVPEILFKNSDFLPLILFVGVEAPLIRAKVFSLFSYLGSTLKVRIVFGRFG